MRIRQHSIFVVSFVVLSTLCLNALAADQTATESPKETQNFVRVLTISGDTFSGIVRLSDTGIRVQPTEGSAQEIPRETLVKIAFPNRAEKSIVPHEVWLSPDDRLRGTILRVTEDELLLQTSDSVQLTIPLELVRGVILNDAGRTIFNRMRRIVAEQSAKTDIVWLKNGDRVRGEFIELTQQQLQIEVDSNSLNISRDSIAGIGFNPELLDSVRPPQAWQHLVLCDGSCLTTRRLLSVNKDENPALLLETLFGAQLRVPLNSVATIRFRSEKIVPLSSLQPDVRYERFLPGSARRGRAFQVNRNFHGNRMQMRGRTMPFGFGILTRTSLTFPLPKSSARLLTGFGIDDSANGKGSAVFSITVDGKAVFRSESQTGNMPIERAPAIDLSGAKSLTLTADFAARGDILDHANWCDPVIIRAESQN